MRKIHTMKTANQEELNSIKSTILVFTMKNEAKIREMKRETPLLSPKIPVFFKTA